MHIEEKKKSIYLLKTTNQRRDLVVQRFVKPRLKLDFVWIFGPKSLINKGGTPHCSRNNDYLRLGFRFRFRFHSICWKLKSPISTDPDTEGAFQCTKIPENFGRNINETFRPGKGGLRPPDMVLFGQSVRCKRNLLFQFQNVNFQSQLTEKKSKLQWNALVGSENWNVSIKQQEVEARHL